MYGVYKHSPGQLNLIVAHLLTSLTKSQRYLFTFEIGQVQNRVELNRPSYSVALSLPLPQWCDPPIFYFWWLTAYLTQFSSVESVCIGTVSPDTHHTTCIVPLTQLARRNHHRKLAHIQFHPSPRPPRRKTYQPFPKSCNLLLTLKDTRVPKWCGSLLPATRTRSEHAQSAQKQCVSPLSAPQISSASKAASPRSLLCSSPSLPATPSDRLDRHLDRLPMIRERQQFMEPHYPDRQIRGYGADGDIPALHTSRESIGALRIEAKDLFGPNVFFFSGLSSRNVSTVQHPCHSVFERH